MSTESTPPAPAWSPPVAQLLDLGEQGARDRYWPDYPAMGFTAEHVPELLRMATDDALNQAEDDTLVWAPMHAWRALGQLRAGEAAAPLAELLLRYDEDDTALEELPRVLGMLGEPALEPVRRIVADTSVESLARAAAMSALPYIAHQHPDLRDRVAALLTRQLEAWPEQDEELNGFLIDCLVDLGVVEAAPLMQAAFEADQVDATIRGDWEDVQVDLGLLAERKSPVRPPAFMRELGELLERVRTLSELESRPPRQAEPRPGKPVSSKSAARRKAQKAARKKNRRK